MLDRVDSPEALVILTIVLVSLAAVVWPAARICRRAGFSHWLGALAAVPVANVILLWFVALAPWNGRERAARG